MIFDIIIADSLRDFASEMPSRGWFGKEHDWVNRYAHGYLLKHCTPDGPLREAAQIAIEVGVPQPPGYSAVAARRDLTIWPEAGQSCWDCDWKAVHHPLVVMEWKVHRPGRRNKEVKHERAWLRAYTAWRTDTVAYSVEADLTAARHQLTSNRFVNGIEQSNWLSFEVGGVS
ncbi:MAG TPA: hypothetical protein VNM92_06705 [Thermoanaerobaculia bacterium]|nr:hypothetical protein [Thermoanaerobaculia bacterium]